MTGTVPRGRDRAPSAPPDPTTSSGHPGRPGLPAERLAALLAGAAPGTRPAPGAGPGPDDGAAPGTRPAPGHGPDDGAAPREGPDHRTGLGGGTGGGTGAASTAGADSDAGARGGAVEPGRRGAVATARPDAAHRWETAARTRVPRSLLVLAAAAVAGLGWAVLGPGGPGEDPGGETALAEIGVSEAPAPSAGSPDPVAGGAPGGGAGAAASSAPGSDGSLHVHVAGEVARPGVVELAPGARVVDAVEAAGGLTDAAADTVNLAAPLTDGQQVLVPDESAAPPAGTPAPAVPPAGGTDAAAAGGTGPAAPGGTLDLNSATAAELEALPRVGPVLAGRIVEFRDQHGGFAAATDLDAVPGIGPTLLEALLPLVTV
ncbi:helix-hairpin-helix domain-containing protein [Kocuria turfanensis]|uniref:helix-hairpin-helix domain-containing protein n=1 Tax=Kocuria turfanensis TaxID=388357 RepID=UPI0040365CC9